MAKPTPPEEPQLVLNYRALKTDALFTLIWLSLAWLGLVWLVLSGYRAGDTRFLVIASSALCCLGLGLHSFLISFGPFLSFYKDHLVINHSVLRKLRLPYSSFRHITIAREEVTILLTTGPPVCINLAQLTFKNQEKCLKQFNALQVTIMEKQAAGAVSAGTEQP